MNISVASWSSFYAFKDILCTNQAKPATILKKRFWHRCFPVNFVKFLNLFKRTPPGDCFWPFADVFKIDILKI